MKGIHTVLFLMLAMMVLLLPLASCKTAGGLDGGGPSVTLQEGDSISVVFRPESGEVVIIHPPLTELLLEAVQAIIAALQDRAQPMAKSMQLASGQQQAPPARWKIVLQQQGEGGQLSIQQACDIGRIRQPCPALGGLGAGPQ
jgi:hypothetical protein